MPALLDLSSPYGDNGRRHLSAARQLWYFCNGSSTMQRSDHDNTLDYCWRERQDVGIHVSQPADPDAWRQTLAFIEYTTRLAERYQL